MFDKICFFILFVSSNGNWDVVRLPLPDEKPTTSEPSTESGESSEYFDLSKMSMPHPSKMPIDENVKKKSYRDLAPEITTKNIWQKPSVRMLPVSPMKPREFIKVDLTAANSMNKATLNKLIKRREIFNRILADFEAYMQRLDLSKNDEIKVTETKLRMETMEATFKDFRDVQTKIEDVVDSRLLDGEIANRLKFESQYYNVMARVKVLLKSFEKVISSQSPQYASHWELVQNNSSLPYQDVGHQLPNMGLPNWTSVQNNSPPPYQAGGRQLPNMGLSNWTSVQKNSPSPYQGVGHQVPNMGLSNWASEQNNSPSPYQAGGRQVPNMGLSNWASEQNNSSSSPYQDAGHQMPNMGSPNWASVQNNSPPPYQAGGRQLPNMGLSN